MGTERTNILCNQILDRYGYNSRMTQRRIEVNTKISQSITIKTHRSLGSFNVDKVLVGSRREGISLFGESDSDVMFILNDVLCTETHQENNVAPTSADTNSEEHNSNETQGKTQTVFHMDVREVPAGYTLLRDSSTNSNEFTHQSTVRTQNGTFLSSSLFLTTNKYKFRLYKGWMKTAVQYLTQNGPSLPEMLSPTDMYVKSLNFLTGQNYIKYQKDSVIAIPCYCPSLLDEWKARTRSTDWPTQDLIQQVVKLPVHVVPVGVKGSIHEDLQWRISCTFAEIHLVQNFNDTQIKLLVLLRMIAKEMLKSICKDISSYVIKNHMLWLSETIFNPQTISSTNLLVHLKCGLLQLQSSIVRKKLPCYMLPERNLLQTLKDEEAKSLVSALDSVIYNTDQELALFLLKTMKKNNIKKLARLDRLSLEVHKDMTPNEIDEIESSSSRSTTSYGQHMSYSYMLLKYYFKKNGIKQLVTCACFDDEDDSEQSSCKRNEYDDLKQLTENGNVPINDEINSEDGNEQNKLEQANENCRDGHGYERHNENRNKHPDLQLSYAIREFVFQEQQNRKTDVSTVTDGQYKHRIYRTVKNINRITKAKLQNCETILERRGFETYHFFLPALLLLCFDPDFQVVLTYIVMILVNYRIFRSLPMSTVFNKMVYLIFGLIMNGCILSLHLERYIFSLFKIFACLLFIMHCNKLRQLIKTVGTFTRPEVNLYQTSLDIYDHRYQKRFYRFLICFGVLDLCLILYIFFR